MAVSRLANESKQESRASSRSRAFDSSLRSERQSLRRDLLLLQEPGQLLAAYRVLKLAHGLGLDLPHALAGHLEDAAHLFERVRVAVAQAVAKADDLALAIGQRLQQRLDL